MNIQKLTSLILSLVMVFCFTVFASASPPTSEKITKTNFEKSSVSDRASSNRAENNAKLPNYVIYDNQAFANGAGAEIKDKNLVRSANFTEPFISAKTDRQFPPGASRKYGQRNLPNYKLIEIKLDQIGANKAREKI